ncbi:type II toxin-antitoxin system HipA family toxin [Flagellimonas onchidii]|uniref:type II toxin-antitoxin system HipA family toxin n=1 Tax=Flagellimonas onchidii TaxID=2562684 RepID=UPI0010A5B12F|nr:type II toxin-antitoxin system HipA family toxin [Allomuricauda onchidii]
MSSYISIEELKAGLQFDTDVIPVGRLAEREGKIYFEYDTSFLRSGLEISPLKLPLDSGLQVFDHRPFEGLPGVFNDSLPDGWGRLLFDRYVRSQNLLPEDFTPLDRLAHVGMSGLGALVYEPDHSNLEKEHGAVDLDILSQQTQDVLEGGASEVLQELFDLNGSSAGARPKALIGLDASKENIVSGKHTLIDGYEHWLVKFANSNDGTDAGAIEYVYALMAKEAGIEMMPVHLFGAKKGAGYFATQRFDRNGNQKLHVHTASGVLHSNFRVPSLDYEDLLTLTGVLTQDIREVEKMYRLAVFNVLSHNRDDHGKNFSFLMDAKGEWKFSPAYDLTFSSGPRGHQSTMVMGEGQSPTPEHLIRLGAEANLKKKKIEEIIEQTKHSLSQWENLASNHGVTKTNIKFIKSRML